ncbi:MAG: DUF4386 domain-containing protein [Candidatus Zixiibacteriota bacterium]
MTNSLYTSDLNRKARLAGVLYLLVVLTGIFCLIYVPGKTIVQGNPTETATRILANETLYRIDLVVGLISIILFMFLGLALYRLLKDVNRWQAVIMVVLVLVQIPQAFASQLLQLGSLELVRGADFVSVLDKSQRDVLAMLCIHVNSLGTHLAEMFWGIWLFPLGLLVIRSGFLPRFLGLWLIINGVAYVVMSITGLIVPQYYETVSKFALPALTGEVAFMLWLLIGGAKPIRGATKSVIESES